MKVPARKTEGREAIELDSNTKSEQEKVSWVFTLPQVIVGEEVGECKRIIMFVDMLAAEKPQCVTEITHLFYSQMCSTRRSSDSHASTSLRCAGARLSCISGK